MTKREIAVEVFVIAMIIGDHISIGPCPGRVIVCVDHHRR